jgi:vancomycin resistance protein YoaR
VGNRRRRVRILPVTLLTLATLIVIAYAVGVAMTRGKIPHGTSIGGIDVGGKTVAQAKALLRDGLGPKATAPIPVTADNVTATIDPVTAGLTLNIDKSVDALGTTSMTPSSILHGLGRGTAHQPVLEIDDAALSKALAAVAAKVDRKLVEGSIHYNGVTPVAVTPVIGRALDQARSATLVEDRFQSLAGGPAVTLPVAVSQPKTSPAQIETALTTLAAPAVAGPLHLTYSGTTVDVPPATLASVLTLQAGPDGSIKVTADQAKVTAAFVPLLGTLATVTPKDATIRLVNGKPAITPSVSATTPDTSALAGLVPAAVLAPDRTLVVPGRTTDPAFTTADAQKLGIKEIVSEFQTPHPCCPPRVTNIKTIAGIVNNAIILPGQTFSLNGYVGPRDVARGFVPAPEILEGSETLAVGGGVSQFATTMYNAAFFAGMEDVFHQPHSFWISRYPPGREATVSIPSPDLKWKNTTPYGVLVQSWDDGNFTHVRFWGTKYWHVDDTSSGKTNVTQPVQSYMTPDELSGKKPCVPTSGETGFSITITRTLSLNGTQVGTTQKWVKRYVPQPIHICKPDPTLTPSPGASGSPTPTKSGSAAPATTPGTSPAPTRKPSTTPTAKP